MTTGQATLLTPLQTTDKDAFASQEVADEPDRSVLWFGYS